MALRSQTAKAQKEKPPRDQSDELEIEELQPAMQRTLYDQVYEMAERFASTGMGQFVIERGDRVLKLVEDTAKWSLPQDKTESKLERPLPWIPFLMMIITLRLACIWISVAALLIGNGPVTPQNAVYFIQTRRRKLRAIRIHGLKEINRREEEEKASQSQGSERGLVAKLKKLLSSAICRPGQHCVEPARRIFIYHSMEQSADDKASTANTVSAEQHQPTKRPRDDECVDMDLTSDQMLSKYANESSDDDSDFIPNPEEETNDDESTSSGTSASSSDEAESEKNVNAEATNQESFDEKRDISLESKDSENGCMPKPAVENKKEPFHDNEIIATPTEKDPSNGGEKMEADIARKAQSTSTKLSALNGNRIEERKSTPGYESAAATTLKLMPAGGHVATAGSPSEFDACFHPVSILKTPTVKSTECNAQSTPKSSEEDSTETSTDSVGSYKRHVQHQQPQKQPGQYQQQNRYRGGRNRR